MPHHHPTTTAGQTESARCWQAQISPRVSHAPFTLPRIPLYNYIVSSEKHNVRNGIIVVVAGSLIISALSAVSPPFWGAVKKVLGWLWAYLSPPVVVSGWLLILLAIGSATGLVLAIALLAEWLREPDPARYKEDVFEGLKWRWELECDASGSAAAILNLRPYCPVDDTALVWDKLADDLVLHCETCQKGHQFRRTTYSALKEKVGRQINRRIRSGERTQERQRSK